MTYTDLNRFHDALKGRPRDRVPIFGGLNLWAAANYPDASFETIASDPELITKVLLWAKDRIGIDPISPSIDSLYIAEAFGCKVRFLDTGALVDPLPISIEGPEDIEKISFPNPTKDGRLPVVLEAARSISEKTRGETPLVGTFEGAFTQTCRIIEVEHILRMIYRKPQVLETLLDRMNDFLMTFAQAFVDNGVNVLFIPEPTASSTMISPPMFRRYVLPRLQSFTARMKVPTVLHICGDTKPILDAMEESGAEVLSLDQCMDLRESRGVVRDKVLAGNVDPVQSLLLGDAGQVERDALHCLRTMGTEHFILMPGCGIPPNTPEENLKAMVRVAVDYGLGE
jgi:MtaA/CmuA family methyltransferase